jgi:transcriptional regulator with XRE-family HTH domain
VTQQEAFGKRLRQLRRLKAAHEERDVEQTEVAAAVGTTQVNITRWENGRIPKNDAMLHALAAFYGVSFVWLRYGKEPQASAAEPSYKRAAREYGGEIAEGSTTPPGKAEKGAKKRRPA